MMLVKEYCKSFVRCDSCLEKILLGVSESIV